MTVMLLYHGYLSDEAHQSWQEAARRSDAWVAGDRFQGAPMRVGGEGKPEPAGLWGYDLLQLDTLEEALEWAELLLQRTGPGPSVEIHRIYDPGELTPRMELASNA